MVESETFSSTRAAAAAMPAIARHRYRNNIAIWAGLLLIALFIGCSNLSNSGPLWPDSSQYANAAAMIHDWLFSGQIGHPWQFAEQNYAQFPAFHLPYHPPGYPAALALFWTLTGGVSYNSARVFIALCLWVAGCSFHGILRKTGASQATAFCGALLLMTTPEIAFWSRDTMSEIPGLAFILAGSYCFLIWLVTESKLACIAAFCFAEMAFQSRYLTAGVLPAWFLWVLLAGKIRKLLSPTLLIPTVLYLAVNTFWVIYTLPYSKFETVYSATPPTTNYGGLFSWKIFAFYSTHIPAMIGWWTLATALVGLICAIVFSGGRLTQFLWPSWLVSNLVFLLTVRIYQEDRYFIYALPGFIGLATATLASVRVNRGIRRYAGPVLVGFCLLGNAIAFTRFPQGVVGFETIGQRVAQLDVPGNILISSFQQTDLILRYRSDHPVLKRSFIRGDRSLAIRPPHYADAQTTSIAHNIDDVLNIIRRGRSRYIVTCSADNPRTDNRAEDMKFLHEVVQSHPASFHLLEKFPLRLGYGIPDVWGRVWLWQFTGELPSGASEIPVVVPTADLSIEPAK